MIRLDIIPSETLSCDNCNFAVAVDDAMFRINTKDNTHYAYCEDCVYIDYKDEQVPLTIEAYECDYCGNTFDHTQDVVTLTNAGTETRCRHLRCYLRSEGLV